MASQINSIYVNIDEAYPVAGVDNDTQGFRDNFDIIKTSLGLAGSEISTLQDTTAKINAANDFAGNTISNTLLVTNTEKSYAPGVFSTGVPQLQYRNGGHQRVILDADALSIVVDWTPTSTGTLDNNRYAKIVVEVTSLDPLDSFSVTWATSGGGDVKFDRNYPINFKANGTPQLLEFSTYLGGDDMWVKYLGEYSVDAAETNYSNYDILSEEVSSGTVDLEKKTTYFDISGVETSTLTAGVEGQIKVFVVKSVSSGEMVVSTGVPGWKSSGGGAIRFSTIGQGCTLQFVSGKWYCIGNNGASFE